MPKNTDDRERLHLLIPAKTKQMLDDLQVRTQAATMTEVIKSALALYDAVTKELFAGKELILRDPQATDPKKREQRVILVGPSLFPLVE